MAMNRSPYEPAYATIADHFRQAIKSGDLAPDARLPSEREICEQWGVSTITARAALTTLRNEGLIRTVKGKGTFVRSFKPLVRISPDRYFRPHTQPTWIIEAERAGRLVDLQHDSRRTTAREPIAERLSINPGEPVMETDYLISMGGQPVSVSLSWEPLAITGGTPIELPHEGPMASRGIVPRFDSIGHRVDQVQELLTFRGPTAEESKRLDIPAGVGVVEVHQTFWAKELPIQTADIVFPADRYQLQYNMVIPGAGGLPNPTKQPGETPKPPTMDSGWEHDDSN